MEMIARIDSEGFDGCAVEMAEGKGAEAVERAGVGIEGQAVQHAALSDGEEGVDGVALGGGEGAEGEGGKREDAA